MGGVAGGRLAGHHAWRAGGMRRGPGTLRGNSPGGSLEDACTHSSATQDLNSGSRVGRCAGSQPQGSPLTKPMLLRADAAQEDCDQEDRPQEGCAWPLLSRHGPTLRPSKICPPFPALPLHRVTVPLDHAGGSQEDRPQEDHRQEGGSLSMPSAITDRALVFAALS